jgi:RNA polymerase sigma-70 factor (ECF subfamily)
MQAGNLAGAKVRSLRTPDDALQEEVRTAVRLVSGIRQGQESARRELVARYSRGLLFLLKRRVGDDELALDLLQDTFHIALKKLPETELECPQRLAGYLRGIAIRVALNASRRRSRETVGIDKVVLDGIEDLEPRPLERVSREQTRAAVTRLLDSLPVKRDRDLLIRFYVLEQDKGEICKALRLDSLHFNRVLYRAKARFRQIIEDSGLAADLAPE